MSSLFPNESCAGRCWVCGLLLLFSIAGCKPRSSTDALTDTVERLGGKVIRGETAGDGSASGGSPARSAAHVVQPLPTQPQPVASPPLAGASLSSNPPRAAGGDPSTPAPQEHAPAKASSKSNEPEQVHVDLSHTKLRDDDLSTIANLEQATSLCVRGTALSDRGLAQLSDARNLRTLDLRNTSITDEGLNHLQSLPNLHYVALDGCNVTEAGVERLRNLLPPGAAVTFDRRWLK